VGASSTLQARSSVQSCNTHMLPDLRAVWRKQCRTFAVLPLYMPHTLLHHDLDELVGTR
jgi:hypothetical protein